MRCLYVSTVFGLIASFAVILVWCRLAGIPWLLSAGVFGFFALMLLIISRVVAEGGLLFVQAGFVPSDALTALFGIRWASDAGWAAMALPQTDPRDRTRIVDGVFRSIARMLVAFAKFPSIRQSNVSRWIRLEGGEHFQRALAGGRGVLFATAHLGNWELSAFAHALLAAILDRRSSTLTLVNSIGVRLAFVEVCPSLECSMR